MRVLDVFLGFSFSGMCVCVCAFISAARSWRSQSASLYVTQLKNVTNLIFILSLYFTEHNNEPSGSLKFGVFLD
jgi:ABC-type arginine transport system permease subunit